MCIKCFYCLVGDHDAVLVLLLVPRLLWKTEVLLNQVKEKFPNVESIDRASLLRGHTVEQYAFRSRLSHLLFNAQVRIHNHLTISMVLLWY